MRHRLPKPTVEELKFRMQFDDAPLDEAELASVAKDVPGPLGEAAKALREASARFEAELKRIGFRYG